MPWLCLDYDLTSGRNIIYFCLLHLTSYGTLQNSVNKHPLIHDIETVLYLIWLGGTSLIYVKIHVFFFAHKEEEFFLS